MNRTLKSTFLFGLLTMITLSAYSQDEESKFRMGVKIIPAFNWVKPNSNNVLSDAKTIGFTFGFMSDIHIINNYFFTPEINITTFNYNIKRKDDEILTLKDDSFKNVAYKYNVKFIEIPLTFKFKTEEKNGLRFWGQVGLGTGFIIRNNVTTSTKSVDGSVFPEIEKYKPNISENDHLDFDEFKDDINTIRMSMILAFGAEYKLSGTTSFYAGLRFNNGFTDILNDSKAEMNNNALGLELGFLF